MAESRPQSDPLFDSLVLDRAQGGAFSIDKPAAVKACAQAKQCAQQGDVDRAEQLLMQALKARPSCRLAYVTLAQIYRQHAKPQQAQCCQQGELPADLLQRYFNATGSVNTAVGGTGKAVFPSQTIALPAPGTTDDASVSEAHAAVFRKKQIVSSASFIDRFESARLWHDSANTMVIDSSGAAVPAHSVGNIPLLHALISDYNPVPLTGRVFLLGARGAHNYYHWLLDIIPKLLIIRAAGIDIKPSDLFVVPEAAVGFARPLLARFGVAREQIVETERSSPYLFADELFVPYLSNEMGYTMGAWLPHCLRAAMLPARSSASLQRKLYISRVASTSAGRALDNKQQVEDFFTQRGFEVVRPEQLDVIQQAELFSQAAVVAGVHGAGFANIVYCEPGTKVIEFYGRHIAPCYWAISALAKLDYYNCSCIEQGYIERTAGSAHAAGFSIPLEKADKLLLMAGLD